MELHDESHLHVACMTYLQKCQWHFLSIVFGVSLITILAFLLPIRKLYKSPEKREVAAQLITKSSIQYGLPKSDFFFTYVGKRDYRLCRREYSRGKDPIICDWHTVTSTPVR